MSNQTQSNNRPNARVCIKEGEGDNSNLEIIGSAWSREDGGYYIKLTGKQIVDKPMYIFPNKESEGDS